MNSGIYTAYSGMQAQMDALDIVANNLANLNTAGFKEEKAFFTVLQQMSAVEGGYVNPLQAAINKTVFTSSGLNGTEGSMIRTQQDRDIAIEGEGFLVVEAPGGIRYTRNGNLKVNDEGFLSTSNGFPVLGNEMKPIRIGPGQVHIDENGDVKQENVLIDRIKLVKFEKLSSLEKEGNSMFVSKSGRDIELSSSAKIRQGFLEQSNVNPVASVVKMVSLLRDFESMQKCMNLISNDMNKKAIETLSR